MPVSYEYTMGSVRAKEKELLTDADIEAMLACKSVPALHTFLQDKGFAEGNSIEDMLKNSRIQTLEYLTQIVPDIHLFDIFLYAADIHNIKCVMKGLLADVAYQTLLITPHTIAPAVIEMAVKEHRYTLLPEWIAAQAEQAYDILAKTADARLADAYLDKQCMKTQLQTADGWHISFLTTYIHAKVFYTNVKIALRASAAHAARDYYETAICKEMTEISADEMIATALKGQTALIEYLARKDVFFSRMAMEMFQQSSADFERFSENCLIKIAIENCKRAGNGAEAALGYYLAKTAEEQVVHMIAVGIETSAGSEVTRERLRDIYGG